MWFFSLHPLDTPGSLSLTYGTFHPSPVVFLCGTFPSICHRTYFHTSTDHVTWIIKKVHKIPTHCGVPYESVSSLAKSHMDSYALWCAIWECQLACYRSCGFLCIVVCHMRVSTRLLEVMWIPMHCGVPYESASSLARSHVDSYALWCGIWECQLAC